MLMFCRWTTLAEKLLVLEWLQVTFTTYTRRGRSRCFVRFLLIFCWFSTDFQLIFNCFGSILTHSGEPTAPVATPGNVYTLKHTSHSVHLILGLNYAVYQPRHVFQNDDFGSKFCIYIPRSQVYPWPREFLLDIMGFIKRTFSGGYVYIIQFQVSTWFWV